jgi:methylated-DNA-protein-cysteine methyltransferase-like protein
MAAPVTKFERRVAHVIQRIPRGKTLAYSQVALRAGRPGGARSVVRALRGLHAAGIQVPWWRVIRADRTMAAEVAAQQAGRLNREGVKTRGRRVLP